MADQDQRPPSPAPSSSSSAAVEGDDGGKKGQVRAKGAGRLGARKPSPSMTRDGGAGGEAAAAAISEKDAARTEALWEQMKRERAAETDPKVAATLNTYEFSKLRGNSGPLDADLEAMQGVWEEKQHLKDEGQGMRPGGPFHGLFGEQRFFAEDLPKRTDDVFDLRELDFGRQGLIEEDEAPRSWFERQWTRNGLVVGLRRALTVVNEVQLTPEVSVTNRDWNWRERARFTTARDVGSEIKCTLEVPEHSLFKMPSLKDMIVGLKTKRPGFECTYDFRKGRFRAQTTTKVLVGRREMDLSNLEGEPLRNGQMGEGYRTPLIAQKGSVLRHVFVRFNYESRQESMPRIMAELHVPFLEEDMLQLNFNLAEMKKMSLDRLAVKASKRLEGTPFLGDTCWLIPSYDFGTGDASLDLQHEMYGHSNATGDSRSRPHTYIHVPSRSRTRTRSWMTGRFTPL